MYKQFCMPFRGFAAGGSKALIGKVAEKWATSTRGPPYKRCSFCSASRGPLDLPHNQRRSPNPCSSLDLQAVAQVAMMSPTLSATLPRSLPFTPSFQHLSPLLTCR